MGPCFRRDDSNEVLTPWYPKHNIARRPEAAERTLHAFDERVADGREADIAAAGDGGAAIHQQPFALPAPQQDRILVEFAADTMNCVIGLSGLCSKMIATPPGRRTRNISPMNFARAAGGT